MQNQQPAETPLLDRFKQQTLNAWRPVSSLTKTIIIFFILAAFFLGLGIPMLILSQQITETVVRYDNNASCEIGSNCTISLTIDSDMQAPVFIYYQLNNYYQNHRLYAKSLSVKQLLGYNVSDSDLKSDCSPIVYNSNISDTYKYSITGEPLNQSDFAFPCGMIAYTIFNDTYTLAYSNGTEVEISDSGIAWSIDVDRYQIINASNAWINITSERFINWMRVAAMPNFRKLWGRINTDIPAGTYQLTIDNQYDISGFNGEKYFVVSQSNVFGSKNDFLSITYIVVGSLCLISAVGFQIKKSHKQKMM